MKAKSIVRFTSSTPTTIIMPQQIDALMGDCNDLWYNVRELQEFRTIARSQSRCLRRNVVPNNLHNNGTNLGFCSRGLELRSSIERQRKIFLTIKFILSTQSMLKNINCEHATLKLAQISSNLSRHATDIAMEEAERDAIEVSQCADVTTSERFESSKIVAKIPEKQSVKRQFETKDKILATKYITVSKRRYSDQFNVLNSMKRNRLLVVDSKYRLVP